MQAPHTDLQWVSPTKPQPESDIVINHCYVKSMMKVGIGRKPIQNIWLPWLHDYLASLLSHADLEEAMISRVELDGTHMTLYLIM